jgi:trigger factor
MENHQIKLVVETTTENFEGAKLKAARKLAQRTKIPGFRPGKAPYSMVARHLGESAIVDEALDIYIQDIYPEALEEAKVEPYGPGELEKVISLDPPQFEFLVPLKPVVELCDYHSIRLDYDYQLVNDEDVDNIIADFRERQAILEPTERPAKEGDVVYVRISSTRTNAQNESDTVLFTDRRVPLVIRPERDAVLENEWPFPGFSRHIIGLSVGDNRIIDYKFPENFNIENLKGIEASYDLTVEEIKSRILPDVNDEFAQSLGEYENLEALRKFIREELEKNHLQTYNQEYEEKVLEKIIDQSKIKFPPQMLKRETDLVLEQLKAQLEKEKSDLNLYLKTRKLSMEELLEEIRPVAEARLKKYMVILELIKAEGMTYKDEDLQADSNVTWNMMVSQVLERLRTIASAKDELNQNVSGEGNVIEASDVGNESNITPEENDQNDTNQPVEDTESK